MRDTPWRVPDADRPDFAWGLLLALIQRAGGEVTLARADLDPALLGDSHGRSYGLECIPGGVPGDELVTFKVVKKPSDDDTGRGGGA